MRRPDMENAGPQDTHVNVATRWENLEEIIATGFCDGSQENILLNSTQKGKTIFCVIVAVQYLKNSCW